MTSNTTIPAPDNARKADKPPAIPGFVTIGDAAKNVLNQFNGLGKNDDIDTTEQ